MISLEDFEVRYSNIIKQTPKIGRCSVKGCGNPRDSTRLTGEDSCCAYHRLLFDFWSCEVSWIRGHDVLKMTQRGRRTAFTNWRKRTGKEALDKIVLRMAKEPINWDC